MKKIILICLIPVLLAIRAFAQTNNSAFDAHTLEMHPGVTLVLKKLPPSLTLVFSADDVNGLKLVFWSKIGDKPLTLTTNVSKDDAEHLQLKTSDMDGAKLLLTFTGEKLTAIGARTLDKPVDVPLDGTQLKLTYPRDGRFRWGN